MRRIHGYVLVKESNRGVPNVVVCAYDAGISPRQFSAELKNAKVPPASFLEKLGQRIGSVLTDKSGAFLLTHDDLHFEGIESRPDLVIVVLAPEDIIDPQLPYVLPQERRLLYISKAPRSDAGAEEAFVIRLRQAQLDAFAIATDAGTRQRQSETDRLLQHLESGDRLRETLRAKLQPQLKAQYQKNMALRKQAKATVQLTALPQHARAHPYLLKDSVDLERTQKLVINRGLKRLKDYTPHLRLRLTATDIRSLGMRINKQGDVNGKADALKLADHLRERIGGVILVRKEGNAPTSMSLHVLAAKYLPPAVTAPTPANPSASKTKRPTRPGRRH